MWHCQTKSCCLYMKFSFIQITESGWKYWMFTKCRMYQILRRISVRKLFHLREIFLTVNRHMGIQVYNCGSIVVVRITVVCDSKTVIFIVTIVNNGFLFVVYWRVINVCIVKVLRCCILVPRVPSPVVNWTDEPRLIAKLTADAQKVWWYMRTVLRCTGTMIGAFALLTK